MTDPKIAETVARLRRYLDRRLRDRQCDPDVIHSYDAGASEAHPEGITLNVAGIEALARDLAAARDRADHAWQRVAEADSAAIKAAAESLQHMLDKQAAEARVATLEASLSGGVLTKNDSLDLLQKLAAAEAARDRLAAELAEARAALPPVLKLIREYSAAFPYAEQPDDDTVVYRLDRTLTKGTPT